jgi:NAD(P)H-nitrite reductase large subunit
MAGNSRSGGRNRVPTEVKVKRGEPVRGVPRNVALAVVKDSGVVQVAAGVPDPVRPLIAGGFGEELWQRLWAFSAAWLRPDTDLELVQMVCELTDEEAQLRKQVRELGDWRDRVQLRNLEKMKFSMMCSLGLTPVDRSRLGAVAVKVETQMEMFRKSVNGKRTSQT